MAKQLTGRLKTALASLGSRPALVALALILAAAGIHLWTDQPGLAARYVSHLDERPVLERTDGWLRIEPGFASSVFHFWRIFEVDWRGWIVVDEAGEYRFRLNATGAAQLHLDGEEVVRGDRERRRTVGRQWLERGPHRIEMRFEQYGPEVLFAVEMKPPRRDWGAVPAASLYERRPGAARRWIRESLARLSSAGRRLLATLVLLTAFAAMAAALPADGWRAPARLSAWLAAPRRRRLVLGAGLGVLFAVAVAVVLPRTGSPFGWDDVRYLDIAAFNRDFKWVLNRYAHVYLLDFFIWLARGDAFLGARFFWSIQFGVVVCALAVSSASLGRRLQLTTFWASLLLLFSQPIYFLRAGASVPDTTVGTLVMAAVALYLHRLRRGPPVFEWQALVIGALTVWAFKCKELGIILLWLPLLFAFEKGRIDWRTLRRKLGFWLLGAVAGLSVLMALDFYYFGDPLYGVRPSYQREVGDFNMASDPQQSREAEGWMDVVSQGKLTVALGNPRMKYMALFVVGAALLAGWRSRSIELRLLHLLPLLYLMMLMVIHVRATYVFLARYLYPVVPVSCFLVAAGFHYLGADDLRWRDVRSPLFFVPAGLLTFLLLAIVAPYEGTWIAAEEFLPAAWLRSIDWVSLDTFVRLVAAPLLVLTLVAALAVFMRHRPTRVLLAAGLVALALALPFSRTLWELRTRQAWQRGETVLHGLKVLGHEVPQTQGAWLEIYSPAGGHSEMFGPRETCDRIARIYLRRPDLKVTCWPALLPEQDAAFLGLADYRLWLETWPGLADTAVFSPAGELVLVRPKIAAPPPES